jgi:hypothetical protein
VGAVRETGCGGSHLLIILAADDDMRMLDAQCGFQHDQGAPEKPGCLCCLALRFVEYAEIVDRQGNRSGCQN